MVIKRMITLIGSFIDWTGKHLWQTLILLWLASLLLSPVTVPRDDSDSPSKRSGMSLYIDYGTGCQYLSTPIFGSLTPRLDADGKQICHEQSR